MYTNKFLLKLVQLWIRAISFILFWHGLYIKMFAGSCFNDKMTKYNEILIRSYDIHFSDIFVRITIFGYPVTCIVVNTFKKSPLYFNKSTA